MPVDEIQLFEEFLPIIGVNKNRHKISYKTLFFWLKQMSTLSIDSKKKF